MISDFLSFLLSLNKLITSSVRNSKDPFTIERKVLWKRYESERQIKNLKVDDLKASYIKTFLIRANWSAKTQRTVKSTLSPLLNDYKPNLVGKVVLKKPTSTLHKPFNNIKEILDEVKLFNSNLYLCCLMTYGCLLRPHREIRELTGKTFLMI